MSDQVKQFNTRYREYLRNHTEVVQVLEDSGFSDHSNAVGVVVPSPGMSDCDSVTVVLQLRHTSIESKYIVASIWRNNGDNHIIGVDTPHYQFYIYNNEHYLNMLIGYINAGKLNLKGESQFTSVDYAAVHVPFQTRLILSFEDLRDGLNSIVGEYHTPSIFKGELKVQESKFINRMEVISGYDVLHIELMEDEDTGTIDGLRFITHNTVAGTDTLDYWIPTHHWGAVVAELGAWIERIKLYQPVGVDIWEKLQPYQIAGGKKLPINVRYTQISESDD